MKSAFRIVTVAAAVCLTASAAQAAPEVGVDVPSLEKLHQAQFTRRAKELVIWSQPLLGVVQTRAAIRKLGGDYNDLIYLSKPGNWKHRVLTPNSQVLYVTAVTNTAQDGPVVLEIPPSGDTAIFGSVMDSFQVPLEDVGPAGIDKGKGGKYLLLPANYQGEILEGYIPVPSERNIGYIMLRTIPKSFSPEDIATAIEVVKQVRIYPLSEAGNLPKQKYIDTYDKIFDTVDPTDSHYFDVLTGILNEETVLEQDKLAMNMLETLGYEHGKVWSPDADARGILDEAVVMAMNELISMLRETGPEYWPGSHWRLPVIKRTANSQFTFKNDQVLDYTSRGLTYSWACCAPKYLGKGTFYVVGTRDSDGASLTGGQYYKFRVPANAPVKQFWSVMVYGAKNAVYLEESERIGISSFDDLQRSQDGSVDIYFGPKPPQGKESNWLPTKNGEGYFLLFRFYGPTQAVAAKTWVLPDLETTK